MREKQSCPPFRQRVNGCPGPATPSLAERRVALIVDNEQPDLRRRPWWGCAAPEGLRFPDDRFGFGNSRKRVGWSPGRRPQPLLELLPVSRAMR